MAYSEKIADRLRKALAHVPKVEEKKMFGGLAFMVDDKMCLAANMDRIMCRIDPALHDESISRKGCQTVIMGGKEYKGYVYVNEDSFKTKAGLDHWVGLALEFNSKAKSSVPQKHHAKRS